LADNLNLTGTARYNLAIRQKIRLTLQNTQRKNIPAAFESMVSYYNHSELNHVNKLALAVGVSGKDVPLKQTKMLPTDNGERFFSEHLDWMRATKPKFDILSRCLCDTCDTASISVRPEESSPQHSPQKIQQTNTILANDEMNTTTHNNTMTTKNSEEKQIATTINNPSTERPTQQPLPLPRVHQPIQPQPQPQPQSQQFVHYHHHQQYHAHQNDNGLISPVIQAGNQGSRPKNTVRPKGKDTNPRTEQSKGIKK